jgi:outer membrane protein OmpA-like peptidoglycan-associated protein
MKCARKCFALVAILHLFGGVLGSSVTGTRGDPEVLAVSRGSAQSDPTSVRAQDQVTKQDPKPADAKPPSGFSPLRLGGIREPPFLKHAFLFDPDSAELGAESRGAVKRSAAWLRAHPDARVLVVGFCDSSGSETCGPALAQRRGAMVCHWLVRFGVVPHQIAGVKGWSTADRDCRTDITKCQQVNRSAGIFIASSAGPFH